MNGTATTSTIRVDHREIIRTDREATMSGKRRHAEREAQRKAHEARENELERQIQREALARGVSVDRSELKPYGSYTQPEFVTRGYYVDMQFVCRSCGIAQVWSAERQKWWYEVAKGDRYSTASQCRPCRQHEKALREAACLKEGEANRYRSPRYLFAKVRAGIEPSLLKAGYRLVGGYRRVARGTLVIDYGRADDLFGLSWNKRQARLAAELLTDGGADVRVVAIADFSDARSTSDYESRLSEFIASVRAFSDGPAQPEP